VGVNVFMSDHVFVSGSVFVSVGVFVSVVRVWAWRARSIQNK
jgi:hypothetical protein